MPGSRLWRFSVDAADASTHDYFRGMPGAFEQTMRGMEACRATGLPFQLNMVIRKETLSQLDDMLRLAVDSGANAAELFDLVAAGRAKRESSKQLLSLEERKRAMEWLAQAQEDCPIVIRVPACPMYPILLQQERITAQALSRQQCCKGYPIGAGAVLRACPWAT